MEILCYLIIKFWRSHKHNLANVVTSTRLCFCLASSTIFSNFSEIASSIQSAPHCEHTVAGTSLTTTTPKPRSTVKVVFPAFFPPPAKRTCGRECIHFHITLLVLKSDSKHSTSGLYTVIIKHQPVIESSDPTT